jgi:tetratricopeptide (TPR) repeat protein
MSIFHPLWAPPNKQELIKGSKILKIADGLPKNDREQDYLDAIGAFYKDWENLDHQTRTKNFEIKMGEVYKKRTDDKEAAVFYALALNASADKSDKTYKNQRKAGEILESLFPDQPNHPGIAHYIIHNYDNPVLAKKALPTARRYADIAPGSAHAQHMPSHIFTRLGLWDESIASNIKSTSSALCYAQNGDIEGHWDEEIHGMDYLVYAYLQQGDNEKAIEQLRYLQSIDKVFPVNFKIYALTAIPSRIAMENKNWDAAAKLEFLTIDIPWEKFPWVKSIIHFSRSIGASRSGQIDLAENEIDILENLYKKLLDSGDSYKANQVLIEINSAKAWLSFAKGYNENAIELMKEAVRLEDNTEKNPTTPGEILPARELLGDMYLAMDKPVKALDAYEMDFEIHPNRFNGIYGAAISAKKLGNNLKAKQYFEKLLILSENSNGTRPEIKESNEFLNKNKLST